MTDVRIGTSGWNYPHWRDVLYPRGVKVADWLPWYASRYDTVEVNTTFYGQPRLTTVASWVERTPERFRFAMKMSRFLTHVKRLDPDAASIEKFETLAEAFGRKLGPVLVQLPPTFAFEAARVARFFERVSHPPGRRYALEARHASWLCAQAIQLLGERGIGWCIADSSRYRGAEGVTGGFVYLRYHGPKRMFSSAYDDTRLAREARRVRRWQERGIEVWAYFNNDARGHAVRNALRLRELVEGVRGTAPADRAASASEPRRRSAGGRPPTYP